MSKSRPDRTPQWHWEQDASLRFSRIDERPAVAAQFAAAYRGKHWTEIHAANLDEADWLHHLAQLAAHEPFFHLELELPQTLDSRLWVTLSGVPVFDGGGVFQGYRGVGKDISEQRLAEEAFSSQNLQLPPASQDTLHRARITRALDIAIAEQQLRLYYQPIVNQQRQVIGYEALLRWEHPQLGLIGPDQFIAVAEQTGQIVPMGAWVLASACRQLAALHCDPARADCTIAVNLSARQLAQPDLADSILQILQSTGAPANRLKLEITESMLLTNIEKTIITLRELTALGIRLSLDDFGTGYSSLSYLKKLPLSQLKIDQSFVRELLTDPVDAAIVKTILQLAKSLGMSAIAEGVELEGQCRVLADMGCREFQGYLFGKPEPFQ
jgi:EAL domain-containing protein (putative c-di-GMP-specific phosphodiesterase class I)